MSFHNMEKLGRELETVVWQHIFCNHPDFADGDTPMWLSNESPFGIEGGDIAVLSKDVIAIGISLRTRPEAIEQLARNILPRVLQEGAGLHHPPRQEVHAPGYGADHDRL